MAPSRSEGPDHEQEGPDLFTKLCIKAWDDDDGNRDQLKGVGYLSPSITFVPDPPLMVGQPAKIRITVHNFGTMDAANVLLEVAYNIWLGNQAEANEPIANLSLPMIAAGAQQLAEVDWTPRDTDAVHACVHARVFDTYSLTNFANRCLLWDSLVNPQAGNKNISLVQVEDADASLVFVYKAKNFLPVARQATMLVTRFSRRLRVGPDASRFPMPMLIERFPMPLRDEWFRLGFRGERENGPFRLWPEAAIPDEFVHGRFGFVTADALDIGRERGLVSVHPGTLQRIEPRSLSEINLEPGVEISVPLVIPPDELPPPGRRRVFQVNYQEDRGLPISHYLFIYH
jgi:hypothetical protein